jgi:chromosome segregation ATPase
MTATKAQEYEALKKIKKIVEDLGTDSYLSITFDGIFEQAESNIQCDFAGNYKEMLDRATKDMNNIHVELESVKAMLENARLENENLKSEIENWKNEYHSINDTADKWAEEANEADEKVKKLTQEIIELKAKLYDLITK